jgi:hypothetical protein
VLAKCTRISLLTCERIRVRTTACVTELRGELRCQWTRARVLYRRQSVIDGVHSAVELQTYQLCLLLRGLCGLMHAAW